MTSDIKLTNNDIRIEGTQITIAAPGKSPTLEFTAKNGNLTLGGEGADGDLRMLDYDGVARLHIDFDGNGDLPNYRFYIDTRNGNMRLGGDGADGDILVCNEKGKLTVGINGKHGNITLGGADEDGDLVILNGDGESIIHINGSEGPVADTVKIAFDGKKARLRLGKGDNKIVLDGDAGTIQTDTITIGNRLDLGRPHFDDKPQIQMDGENGRADMSSLSVRDVIEVGSKQKDGEIVLKQRGNFTVEPGERPDLSEDFGPARERIRLMGNSGQILFTDSNGQTTTRLTDGGLFADGINLGSQRIRLLGNTGEILFSDGNGQITTRLTDEGLVTDEVTLGNEALTQVIQELRDKIQTLEDEINALKSAGS